MSAFVSRETLAEVAVLHALCLGAHLEVNDKDLHLYPHGAFMPDELVSQLGEHKDEVLRLLESSAGNVMSDFVRQAEETPESVALIFNAKPLSYSDLLSSVAGFVNSFVSDDGFSTGQRIVVLLPRSPDLVTAILALFSLGAVVVPVDPVNPRKRILGMLEQAQPACVICDSVTEPLLAGWTGASFRIDAICSSPEKVAAPLVDVSSKAQSAYLLFTSGSSGTPKGVLVSHSALYASLHALNTCIGINAKTRMLAMATVGFDIAWFELLAPLMVGGQVYLLDDAQSHSAEFICQLMSTGQVNCVQAMPSRWKLLLMQGWQRQTSLTVISGGEALSSDLAAKLWRQQGDFWNLYGPTEATIWAMAQQVNTVLIEADKPLPEIGMTLPHMKSGLERSHDNDESHSELILSGQGLAIGYFRDLDLTDKQFEWCERVQLDGTVACERWYHTGDLVRPLPDNRLAFLGRIDRQVKVNGYRIELTEIEEALKRHTSVADAVLLVETVSDRNAESALLTACVVAVEGSHNKTAEKLNEFLSRSLPDYMLPARYRFLEHIPLNANGKTDYRALTCARPVSSDGTSGEKNCTVTGQIKRRICDLLELDDIGLHDSFFDLGGSSILAAVLLMAINNDYGIEIPLATMLARPPTLAGLALLVERHGGAKGNMDDPEGYDLYRTSVGGI